MAESVVYLLIFVNMKTTNVCHISAHLVMVIGGTAGHFIRDKMLFIRT